MKTALFVKTPQMTKAEQLRVVTFRSKFLEHAKRIDNVSATCRLFGISRQKFYKWKRRFDELAAAGLGDRPTRPHHSPNATRRPWSRTVQNSLRKHGLGIPGTKKRLYQFTAIDDCTGIRVLKIYDTCSQSTAVAFANEVIRRLPFRIDVVQTDNGAEFQSNWHLDALDIRHAYIKPWTPRLNGKVERSHRVDNEEFYQLLDKGGISDDVHLFNKKPRDRENHHNDRPHGGLGGQTPFERLLDRANRKVSRKSLLPTALGPTRLERRFRAARQMRSTAQPFGPRRAPDSRISFWRISARGHSLGIGDALSRRHLPADDVDVHCSGNCFAQSAAAP
jgi:hypothetical protein